MSKLNKVKKEKIKKGILTGLHVLGYICIGFTALVSIILGVKGCNPNVKQVNAETYDYSVYNYGSCYNIDTVGNIAIDQGDIYYVNPNYVANVSGGQVLTASKVIDIQVNNSSTGIGVRFNSIALYSNGAVFKNNGTDQYTLWFDTNTPTLVCFVDTCTFSTSSNQHQLYSFFNNILIKVDKLTYSFDVQTSLYDQLNYNYYVSLVNDNWVSAGTKYLFPFVLNLKELQNNYYRYYYAPISISSTYYYQFDIYTDSLHILDFAGNSSGQYTSEVLFYGLSTYENQVLGYSPFNTYIFTTYAGCYKFHNLYVNFLNYCFPVASNITDSDINNGYSVNTNLNYQFSCYYIYRDAEQNNQISNNFLKIFDNAIIRYDGSQYDAFGTGYWEVNWHQRYFVGTQFNQPLKNGIEPLFEGLLLKARYYQIYRSLSIQTSDPNFVKLMGVYDPNYYIGDNTGSAGSSSTTGLSGIFVLLGDAFTSISDVLNIQLFGAFTLGSLIFIPLVVTIVLFIVKMFKR